LGSKSCSGCMSRRNWHNRRCFDLCHYTERWDYEGLFWVCDFAREWRQGAVSSGSVVQSNGVGGWRWRFGEPEQTWTGLVRDLQYDTAWYPRWGGKTKHTWTWLMRDLYHHDQHCRVGNLDSQIFAPSLL
jgi:hypothetical protein